MNDPSRRAPRRSLRDLPVTLASAHLRPRGSWRPAPDLSVTLRGALGSALFDVACVRDHRKCEGCAVHPCMIPDWYDPSRSSRAHHVRPFTLHVRTPALATPEDGVHASWSFLGPVPWPAAFLVALQRAALLGLGRNRVPHDVARLQVYGEGAPVEVVEANKQVGIWPRPGRLADFLMPAPPSLTSATLHVRGPLRLHRDLEPEPPSGADVLRGGFFRMRDVTRALGFSLRERWPDPDEVVGTWLDVDLRTHRRRASDGSGSVDLAGWQGTLHLAGDLAPYADLLAAMAVLGVGKNTSSGMGFVDVSWG